MKVIESRPWRDLLSDILLKDVYLNMVPAVLAKIL
jgi:hypothetical protein